jgi:hypothetical protein
MSMIQKMICVVGHVVVDHEDIVAFDEVDVKQVHWLKQGAWPKQTFFPR